MKYTLWNAHRTQCVFLISTHYELCSDHCVLLSFQTISNIGHNDERLRWFGRNMLRADNNLHICTLLFTQKHSWCTTLYHAAIKWTCLWAYVLHYTCRQYRLSCNTGEIMYNYCVLLQIVHELPSRILLPMAIAGMLFITLYSWHFQTWLVGKEELEPCLSIQWGYHIYVYM